jgi:hypothetical protein
MRNGVKSKRAKAKEEAIAIEHLGMCNRIAKGISFTRKEKDKAAAEIDRMREANAKRFGSWNIAVDLVRKMRNSQ